jgi:cytochrome c-type biogenesis protein CcmE
MTKGIQIAIGATAIAGLLGWYGASNLDKPPAFTYFKSLEEFQANPDARSGARSRIHGFVAEASISRDIEAMQVRFRVQNTPAHLGRGSTPPLEVVLASLETPDLFKDGAEVVVEGRMVASDGGPVFEADKILAKCPSKFEAAPTGSAES